MLAKLLKLKEIKNKSTRGVVRGGCYQIETTIYRVLEKFPTQYIEHLGELRREQTWAGFGQFCWRIDLSPVLTSPGYFEQCAGTGCSHVAHGSISKGAPSILSKPALRAGVERVD